MEFVKTLKSRYSLDATKLKLLAIVLMVVDHIHQMWASAGAPIWLTWLGRPVFPIFLFAMAESFHFTRNRKKFLVRLLLASWFMTVFGVLLQAVILPNDDIALMNNAFSTFFMAGLYMLFWDIFTVGIRERKPAKVVGAVLLCFVPILTAFPSMWISELSLERPLRQIVNVAARCVFPNILLVEGGPHYVLLGVLFYILRKNRAAQCIALAAFSLLLFLGSRDPSNQWLAILAIIPITLYNGERARGLKYFFYIFYPAHIYLLYFIATLT